MMVLKGKDASLYFMLSWRITPFPFSSTQIILKKKIDSLLHHEALVS